MMDLNLHKLTIEAGDLGKQSRLRNRATGETTEWQPWQIGSVIDVPQHWKVRDCVMESVGVATDCVAGVTARTTE